MSPKINVNWGKSALRGISISHYFSLSWLLMKIPLIQLNTTLTINLKLPNQFSRKCHDYLVVYIRLLVNSMNRSLLNIYMWSIFALLLTNSVTTNQWLICYIRFGFGLSFFTSKQTNHLQATGLWHTQIWMDGVDQGPWRLCVAVN